ncbi:E3 ubiquitin-protein ligase NRDP1 [Drosophila grimshawi]|uniref:E3 ubiquitin-protein ligase NRDP1 n=1 Tax=Drosophila grimshawi TaxID=7222 RepID=B4JP61_DROGR|nr:E3 ubiquitin-protein ligase NRDP1 [Drosophila grimshawi]EDV99486.1 GH13876 [Drosophila grimshawi]
MGFDQSLIVGHVDEELLCPICADVLEEPLQSSGCEHAFCRFCIETWMNEKHICPVDRSDLLPVHLVTVPRFMRNMLGRLKIKCCFSENGCSALMPLEQYRRHVENCQSNPKVEVLCTKGCGMKVPKDEMFRHNCVLELRLQLQHQLSALSQLQQMQSRQEQRLVQQRRELEMLQHYIATLRATNPVIRTVGDQLDRYWLMRWGRSLPLASVRTWGSLISTPDSTMVQTVREGLRASGCPMRLMGMLLDCSYEESWPDGLSTLEMRRMNQHRLAQFVTRLLPIGITGRPCVILLGGDNAHMPDNLRPALGIVIIFINGVDETHAELSPAPLSEADYP